MIYRTKLPIRSKNLRYRINVAGNIKIETRENILVILLVSISCFYLIVYLSIVYENIIAIIINKARMHMVTKSTLIRYLVRLFRFLRFFSICILSKFIRRLRLCFPLCGLCVVNIFFIIICRKSNKKY